MAVGRVVRPHGIRGDLVLEGPPDIVEQLAAVEAVYIGDAAAPHAVESVRRHRGRCLLRLAGCRDRTQAERFRGQIVQVAQTEVEPLAEGQYYHRQIVGLTAVTEAGEILGQVSAILETGANDVYVVSGPEGEILLPAIDSVVKAVDLAAGRMVVHLLDGLR